MKNEKIIRCECPEHILGLEWDNELYMSFWFRYIYPQDTSILKRIRTAWKYLTGKTVMIDDLVLNREKTLEVIEFLSEMVQHVPGSAGIAGSAGESAFTNTTFEYPDNSEFAGNKGVSGTQKWEEYDCSKTCKDKKCEEIKLK